MLTVKTICTSP